MGLVGAWGTEVAGARPEAPAGMEVPTGEAMELAGATHRGEASWVPRAPATRRAATLAASRAEVRRVASRVGPDLVGTSVPSNDFNMLSRGTWMLKLFLRPLGHPD